MQTTAEADPPSRRARRAARAERHRARRRAGLVAGVGVGVGVAVIAVAASMAGTGGSDLDAGGPDPATSSAAPATTGVPSTTTTIVEPRGWTLLWSDEFDGTGLDTTVWTPEHSTYGHANLELQCHTPDNVEVSGGTLRITAQRDEVTCPNGAARAFTSGFLGTRDTGTYFPRFARFEIRARVPHGQGLWPAFWLRHRDGAKTAEVDVMEYFHATNPGKATSSVHLDEGAKVSRRAIPFEEPTDEPGWHVWTVDIEPVPEGVQFSFYRDTASQLSPVSYHRYVDTSPAWAGAHPGADLWDIAVNLSVGGRWAGRPDDPLGHLDDTGGCAQGGEPPDCSDVGIRRASFPAVYEVDYVRVFTPTRPAGAPGA